MKWNGPALGLLLLAPVTACSSQHEQTAATAEPTYLFDKVQSTRSETLALVVEPRSLKKALPGSERVVDPAAGDTEPTWSDLVVTGHIIDVRPGDALVYDNIDPGYVGDEEEFRELKFDDPAAHERNVLVTVKPDWAEGDAVSGTVEFRMGVLGGADPYEFMASLRGLQASEVVVVLDAREDGRDEGDYYPIMGGALIGTVEADGGLAFPALGATEEAFVGDIDTVEELQEAAR